ncbi:MAG: YidC/Oxa1 family membrane protein insertase [Candidatus Doudnabacteria bacterium]
MNPLINLMVLGYQYIPDIGVVIILITVVVRLLLLPSFHKSLKAQRAMTELQPKLNDLREKHKEDKVAQSQAIMALYQEHKVSPLGSCLPLLIQLPLLIALYRVFILGLGGSELQSYLYPWVHNPGVLDPTFFNIVNLSKPSIIFGVVAGIAQFIQSKMMVSSQSGTTMDTTQKALQIQTVYVFPVLTVLLSIKLPAGLPLYWIVTTLFAIGQQYYIMKGNKPKVEVV